MPRRGIGRPNAPPVLLPARSRLHIAQCTRDAVQNAEIVVTMVSNADAVLSIMKERGMPRLRKAFSLLTPINVAQTGWARTGSSEHQPPSVSNRVGFAPRVRLRSHPYYMGRNTAYFWIYRRRGIERPISVPIGRADAVIGQGSGTDQAMSYFLVSQTGISRGTP